MALKNAFRSLPAWWTLAVWLVIQVGISAQTPVVTVRFANPQNDCVVQEYCLDVEFKADLPDQEVFGMNVRFFYDDQLLELVDFRDFQGGYGAVAPDPPILFTSEPAGPALFNFSGPAEFVNGAIQLVNSGSPQIILDTNWTKLFQICFDIDGPIPNLDTFCPPVVWDLEQDPANGGFLSGDDGVVITIVDPDPNNESYAAIENVVQFNWEYTGNGSAPFGQPVEQVCHNINCALPVTLLLFKGYSEPFGNVLEWQATGEINVLGYEIQRSADRQRWERIGFEHAGVTPQEIRAYSFVDNHPVQGNNYYRLKQLDRDGRYAFSTILNIPVADADAMDEMVLYPNPVVNGRLSVFTTLLHSQPLPVRLIDPQGRVVREFQLDQSTAELDVDGLPSGVYMLMIQSGGQRLTRKVLIDE